MLGVDDFVTTSGVILARTISGESGLRVTLFLRDIGLIAMSSANFGGDSEPYVWARFNLKKNKRVRSYRVHDIDVQDGMFRLRDRRESMLTVISWAKLLLKYVEFEQPDNELLTILYWNMKLLCVDCVPPEAINWRFVWQWLTTWGLAPELLELYAAKNFNADELSLLAQLILLTPNEIPKLLSQPLSKKLRRNVFNIATKIALTYLNEK